MFAADICRHNLQLHRSGHPPAYMEAVNNQLTIIQDNCKDYCRKNQQKILIEKLNKLSKKVHLKIKDWDKTYLLRKDSVEIKHMIDDWSDKNIKG